MKQRDPYRVLVARYCDEDDPPPRVTITSFADWLAGGPDPERIFEYLSGLGIAVERLEDLELINEHPDEEELSAHRCAEGVAIAHASDGWWVVFTNS